mgnify:FL=1
MGLIVNIDKDVCTIQHANGTLTLTEASKVGNMIYGFLNGDYIQICTTAEPDGFFYGIWTHDGSRLQIMGL